MANRPTRTELFNLRVLPAMKARLRRAASDMDESLTGLLLSGAAEKASRFYLERGRALLELRAECIEGTDDYATVTDEVVQAHDAARYLLNWRGNFQEYDELAQEIESLETVRDMIGAELSAAVR